MVINWNKSKTLNKKPKVDLTMDEKLGVELDVKLAIKTICKQWHKKVFKVKLKKGATLDTKNGTK